MKLLHVGCGPQSKAGTTPYFQSDEWQEIRFDIDPSVKPDIQGTLTDMSAVESGSIDAVYSSHNIEHLYPHEVPVALKEILRVLKDDGIFVVTCPDMVSVCKLVAEDKLLEPAYISPAGPIAPLDIMYGHRAAMEKGNLYMAHRCGFTQKVLMNTLAEAGFQTVVAAARPSLFDLWAVGSKSKRSAEEVQSLVLAQLR
ncbi:putative SAM-dependent methyltransferase [Undibacterium pigrum]|uniref:Putative SAM-dependent methyltransferase n=1 Tax=Undibacterium pigrum TaxID=401470 RepID=A0A318J388_9BURK|nr:methyltransferase domain-containing protein [Undibacterium pigrum]PXX41825.1 putative SAM-dependent methyltransferase [Undibacterium pigrum]